MSDHQTNEVNDNPHSNDTAAVEDIDESSLIENTKQDIQYLIQLIAQRKAECKELENETAYLKEYSGSYISMGDLRK